MRNEEPVFPWDRADFRHHVLRIRPDIDACATRWQLEKPWITRTMHRTVRVWHLAPTMRASRQWAPVLPEDGWGHRRSWRRREVPQYRGFKPTPTSKIQAAELFHWWVRYHLLHEGYETIAGDPHRKAAVRRLAHALDLPLRKGRPGRPRTHQI